ncbi:MAG: hypothetical protein R3F59_18435 [Myxococcota bacterium]
MNLSRGQRYQQRWKENLGWAVDAYEKAVRLAPGSCQTWGRLAATVVSAAENDEVRVPRSRIEAWPLERGWKKCPGAAMFTLAFARAPSPAELAAAKLDAEASEADRLAAAAPWTRAAVQQADLGSLTGWLPLFELPPPAPGQPFVVLEPATGASVDGSTPRRFTHPEWQIASKVAGDRVVYLDRRFAAQVPERAVTLATACPGTTWTLEGKDRIPRGTCVAGPQDRRAAELYDPKILVPTGPAHFHEPSIDHARLAWSTVADKPVRCLGGPVGRQFYDVPSCEVSYDRAVPVTRALPRGVGIGALSEAHAELIVQAARSEALFGPEIASHLAHGEVATGLPYPLYTWAQPDLQGCRGRGVFSKLEIVDGQLQFRCTAGGKTATFRELALTELSP